MHRPTSAFPALALSPIVFPALAVLPAAAPAAAQQQARPDTLRTEEVAELEARLDSLEALIARLRSEIGTGADTARDEAGDDALARLRRAAEEAAGEAAGETDTASGAGESRTRSLQALNPEISVTGDVVSHFADPSGEGGEPGFTPREFELSFQAALDPYTRTKVFLALEEELPIAGLEAALESPTPPFLEEDEEGDGHGDGVHLEEGYLYWVGLPASIGLKLGRFRQEIGRYNRWHTHALSEVDRPLAAAHFLGEDGLIQTGASVSLPSFSTGAGTHTLTLEATAADNHALFLEGDGIAWLGDFTSFWELSPGSYFEVGATGLAGHDDGVAEGVDLETRLLALDASFRWTPTGRELYRDLRLAAEWYVAEKDFGVTRQSGRGGYLQANYRLDRRWVVGARGDWLDGYGDGPRYVQLAPHVSWWQSEWVRLRLQYSWLKPEGGSADHTLLFQTVWAIGPHRHEEY